MIIGIHMIYLFLKGGLFKELIPVGLLFGIIEVSAELGTIAIIIGK